MCFDVIWTAEITWKILEFTCKNTTAKAAEVANFPNEDNKTIIQSDPLGIIMVARQANPENNWVPIKVGLLPSLSRVKRQNR